MPDRNESLGRIEPREPCTISWPSRPPRGVHERPPADPGRLSPRRVTTWTWTRPLRFHGHHEMLHMDDRDCTHDRLLSVGWLDLNVQSRPPSSHHENTIRHLHTIDYQNRSSLQSGVL